MLNGKTAKKFHAFDVYHANLAKITEFINADKNDMDKQYLILDGETHELIVTLDWNNRREITTEGYDKYEPIYSKQQFLKDVEGKNPSAVIIDKLIAVEWDLCERIMLANKPPLTDDEKRQIDEAWNVAEDFVDIDE